MLNSKALERPRRYASRVVGGFALILVHEIDAVSGHVAEAFERMSVARQARGMGELIRNQFDLFPETRARLALDQQQRRQLIGEWFADMTGPRSRA